MIKSLTTEYDVQEMCEALSVSASGYYDWLERKPSKRQESDQVLSEQIRAVHAASRKTYGRPRITLTLRDQGRRCSSKRVARLMRQNGLQGAQKARYKPKTTDSNHDLPISPNRLAELPAVVRINQCGWVTLPTSPPWRAGCTWQPSWT